VAPLRAAIEIASAAASGAVFGALAGNFGIGRVLLVAVALMPGVIGLGTLVYHLGERFELHLLSRGAGE